MKEVDWSSFFQRLDTLPRGERASLKREAGTMLSQADGQAMRVFFQCLPFSIPQWQEERAFAAACLYCLWDTDEKRRQPLEQIFYQLGRNKEMSESTGHRLEMLLDIQWDEDGFMLKKLSRLIRHASTASESSPTVMRKPPLWQKTALSKPDASASSSFSSPSQHSGKLHL